MNTHKNARLTFVRRQEVVRDMIEHQMTPATAGAGHAASSGSPRASGWAAIWSTAMLVCTVCRRARATDVPRCALRV
jgi:hypothetical protein